MHLADGHIVSCLFKVYAYTITLFVFMFLVRGVIPNLVLFNEFSFALSIDNKL